MWGGIIARSFSRGPLRGSCCTSCKGRVAGFYPGPVAELCQGGRPPTSMLKGGTLLPRAPLAWGAAVIQSRPFPDERMPELGREGEDIPRRNLAFTADLRPPDDSSGVGNGRL